MSYTKFLKARSKSGMPPTIEKNQMSVEEKARVQKGICIKCGLNSADKNSYVCMDCQSADTLEDIQHEIAALRRRLLKTQQS